MRKDGLSKMNEKVRAALKFTHKNTKKNAPQAKKQWYIIGKYLMRGGKITKYHNENKLVARRTYEYYGIDKGDWDGPSPRQLGKMNKDEYFEVLMGREQLKRGTLLENENTTH